ncbi:MAG: class I SAM-dependent methyltransferase [Candidatus Zixiibacteriota bacterium]|nr:MAG: class I SAM-dependent methyltransferase [candidate division Zixibacteria bacterium]
MQPGSIEESTSGYLEIVLNEVRTMERAEWLKQMRDKAEALYDHFSPLYWVKYGLSADETHREYLQKFLERLAPRSTLLSAGCGAGRYDGMLLAAGHSVVGIDLSEGMLARARERFPEARYEKMGLQEMDFRQAFAGVICIDALEHVCPEDWPGILRRFRRALKPGGVLYFTVDRGGDHVAEAYERAKAKGLPVLFGEVADQVEEAYEQALAMEMSKVPAELGDSAVYHYHPSLEQVRTWLGQAGLAIEEEGTGTGDEHWYGYEHFIVRKRSET